MASTRHSATGKNKGEQRQKREWESTDYVGVLGGFL